MKPLLVGYCPRGEPTWIHGFSRAFVGSMSGKRLARVSGLADESELEMQFDLVNLYSRPDPTYNTHDAMMRARRIYEHFISPRVVVFGWQCRDAFYLENTPSLTWETRGDRQLAWCPHPSGRVRWWNSTTNVKQATEFFTALVSISTSP